MMASSTLFLFLFILACFLNLFGTSVVSKDHCSTAPCNPNNEDYTVNFPFRLQEFQPNTHCGYNQSFTLSCSPGNNRTQTLLHLSNAGSFAINNIAYRDQMLYIADPHNCFAQRFFDGLALSGPFFSRSVNQEYTYYNCTQSGALAYSDAAIPCMSGVNYTIIALSRTWPQILPYCTVIKSVLAPVDGQQFSQLAAISYITLYWHEPNCLLCVKGGGDCGFIQGGLVGCHEPGGHGLSTAAKYDIIIGISFPGMLIMILAAQCCAVRSERTRQPPSETQDEPTTVEAGLDEKTIESYPKFVLGQGDVLLEPNRGACAICLSDYKSEDMLRTIPDCSHYFHAHCVDEWLKLNATCPVCRKVPDAS